MLTRSKLRSTFTHPNKQKRKQVRYHFQDETRRVFRSIREPACRTARLAENRQAEISSAFFVCESLAYIVCKIATCPRRLRVKHAEILACSAEHSRLDRRTSLNSTDKRVIHSCCYYYCYLANWVRTLIYFIAALSSARTRDNRCTNDDVTERGCLFREWRPVHQCPWFGHRNSRTGRRNGTLRRDP